jgi:hypothetical protein
VGDWRHTGQDHVGQLLVTVEAQAC